MRSLFRGIVTGVVLVLAAGSARAQWLSQSVALKPGWCSVYLHVDASYATLDELVAANPANPILEVWMWNPSPFTIQYVDNAQQRTDLGSQWTSWNRTNSANSSLQRLVGNNAYLVRLATNVTSYTWVLKGRPVPPGYAWTTAGENLIGFPTVPTGPPTFESFLAKAPDLKQYATFYQYVGGPLGAANPAQVTTLRTTLVTRGQAYWVHTGEHFNRYFAPFSVSLTDPLDGLDFGAEQATRSFRLKNMTTNMLGVTARLRESESPPAGQPTNAPVPPLLIRGALDFSNQVYSSESLAVNGTHLWTLAPAGVEGSEVEVVLGVNRALMTNAAGTAAVGILDLTDSLGQSLIQLPLSAERGSMSGLWVGEAKVTAVGQYLKSYVEDPDGAPVADSNGQYQVSAIDTTLAPVQRSFPLRLILHNPESGNAVLLQRVYCGVDAYTNPVVAVSESSLNPAFFAQSRRISATHLPWSESNTPWPCSGRLAPGTSLTVVVPLDYADPVSNPFLHSYHPDHDNLDATFDAQLPQGSESYSVERVMTVSVRPMTNDFVSLTEGQRVVAGDYTETMTMRGLARAGGTNDTRQFTVQGAFVLRRILDVDTLTLP